jgi:hypothetical protein
MQREGGGGRGDCWREEARLGQGGEKSRGDFRLSSCEEMTRNDKIESNREERWIKEGKVMFSGETYGEKKKREPGTSGRRNVYPG